MSDYHINILNSDEDGGYIADIPDFDSCFAFGETAEQALEEVGKAEKAWIEAAQQSGTAV
jgi:predicted RNase H-like HicB family nuclease